jgi:poly(3-hydroxybutyrate) depolymerase
MVSMMLSSWFGGIGDGAESPAPGRSSNCPDRRVAGPRSGLLSIFVGLVASLSHGGPAVALETVSEFGDNPGALEMFIHRPAEFRDGLPLVVALHGCTQTAGQFDDETGLVALAEEVPFVLVLPQQRPENMERRCFRWYDREDNRPGLGESASILSMIGTAIDQNAVDPDRVYVLGLSAGGAMTAVMLANHPDRFAGGAIFAATPFDCNRPSGVFDWTWYWLHYSPFAPDGADAAYACGIGVPLTRDRTGEEWARYVRDVAEETPERWPPVSLWHGGGDETVDPDNLVELIEQWTAVNGIDAVPDQSERIGNASRDVYTDATGAALVEAWSLDDFPHAFPIDADGTSEPCGIPAEYIVDTDLCAIRRLVDFWGLGD